jgi:plastocyanin
MTRDNSDQNAGGFGPFRRDVLKAVGAGGALTALGGVGGASQRQVGTDEGEDRTVHVVRTLIGPSTNPERPADFYYQPTGISIEAGDTIQYVFETPDHTVSSYHPAYGMQRRIPSGVEPFSSPLLGWDPDSLPDDITEPPAVGPPGESAAGAGGGESTQTETPTDEDDEVGLYPGTPTPAQAGDGATNESDAGTGTNGTSVPSDGSGAGAGPQPSTWSYTFETPGVYDIECAPHEAYGMAMRVVVGDETETDFETSAPEALPEPRAGPVGLARLVLTDPALEPETIVERGEVRWQDLEANQNGATSGEDSPTPAEPTGTPDSPATEEGGTNATTDGNVTDGNVTDGGE